MYHNKELLLLIFSILLWICLIPGLVGNPTMSLALDKMSNITPNKICFIVLNILADLGFIHLKFRNPNMAQACITNIKILKNFWYRAIRQSAQVLHYIPCSVKVTFTTPHELVNDIKPDLPVLFSNIFHCFFTVIFMIIHSPDVVSQSLYQCRVYSSWLMS